MNNNVSIDEIITSDDVLNFCIDNNICYIKTDFFYGGQFIWRGKIHPQSISDCVVIGHSDYPVTYQISKHFKKVFCINKDSNCENTFCIPLGLCNDCDDSPIHRIYGNKNPIIEVMNESIKKENLLYMNFSINNFPMERQLVWDIFCNLNWVKKGEINSNIDGRKKFLRDIKSSKFVLCPRGNGIDTHRLWETLYMGSIPIVRYENAHHLFTDLPILFIEDWSQINIDFLNSKYDEIINKEWNIEKLKLSYWKNFIINKIK